MKDNTESYPQFKEVAICKHNGTLLKIWSREVPQRIDVLKIPHDTMNGRIALTCIRLKDRWHKQGDFMYPIFMLDEQSQKALDDSEPIGAMQDITL